MYSRSVFFNILYSACANKLSAYGNSICLVRAILLLLDIISVIKRQWQFFPSSAIVYFNEIFHSGQLKRILRLVATVFCFVQRFFLLAETITETSGSQLQKKQHILTNVTKFLASGTHFLSFSQTTVNYYQWKQFILQLANPSFRLVEMSFLSTRNSIVLFRVFSSGGNYYSNLWEVNF